MKFVFLAAVITCRRQWKLEIETRSMEIRWTECLMEWNYFAVDQHSEPSFALSNCDASVCGVKNFTSACKTAAVKIFNCDFSFCFYLTSKSSLRPAIKGFSTAGACWQNTSLKSDVLIASQKIRERKTCPAMDARTKKCNLKSFVYTQWVFLTIVILVMSDEEVVFLLSIRRFKWQGVKIPIHFWINFVLATNKKCFIS